MVIPKQDTSLSIADRSLSRLRGSPLPDAGCRGPVTRVGGAVFPDAVVQVLSLAWVRLFQPCVAAAALPPVRFWVGCAAWVWLGAWGAVLRRCVFPAGCCCGGFAAGARLGWLCHWVLAGCMACVLRWRVFPAGCCCGGFGRRCALGLAVPLGLGWVHGLRLALARLSCRVQLPRFATGAFLVCFAAIPAGSIAYAGEALSVGIPWLR